MESGSDTTILNLFQKEGREKEAFTLLINEYQQRLYWHIRRIVLSHEDADDAVQETFIKAWEHLHEFRGNARLYTWLYRIATNEALALIKKQKKRNWLPISDHEHYLSAHLESGPYYSGDAIEKKFQKALLKLPDKQRVVFNMKYFDEMKYEDISAVLGTSVGALKASYHHAVKKIEKYLQQD
ncbi:MAG: RNA polymerase sigma factor [Chlorobi bacterium]|nr:RNA polymerase sigma factor [Chlorobiota bacterium]